MSALLPFRFVQLAGQSPECLTAVTASVLFLRAEFRRANAQLHYEKQRVVTETAIATTFLQNPAAPLTFTNNGIVFIGRHKAGNTAEYRAALLIGNAIKLCKQSVIILLVCSVGSGESRRIDAGPAIERIDTKAGVVRDRGKSRCISSVACFYQCVFEKGRAGFIGITDAKLGLRYYRDIEIAKYADDLFELAGIAAGQNDFVGPARHDN